MAKRGRPPLAPEPSVDVHVRMPPYLYDCIYRKAQCDQRTLPDTIRDAIAQFCNLKSTATKSSLTL